MPRRLVLLIVLLVSGTVASAQGAAAPQRGGREQCLQESTSSKS